MASALLGGWRVAGIQQYASGTIWLGTTVSFPNFNRTNRATAPTYDGWRAPASCSPCRFLRHAAHHRVRQPDQDQSEAAELLAAHSITLKGEQKRLDFRWEAFNLLNRTQFGSLNGGATLQNNNWGLWRTQANSQRRMQVSLKLYW